MNNIRWYIKGYRKLIVVLVMIVYIASVFSLGFWLWDNSAEAYYYASQIISSFFLASGALIAGWQYYLTAKSTKTNLEVIQVQRAIDLAEYYKDNILKYSPSLKYIFAHQRMIEISNKINCDADKYFDKTEIERLLTNEEVNFCHNIHKDDEFLRRVIKASEMYDLGLNNKYCISETEIMTEDIQIGIARFFSKLMSDVLNNTEYFAMHFEHNVADESVVYESLHQNYIILVELLYVKIANENTAGASKYYTNLISLYRTWKKRDSEKQERYVNGMRELVDNGTKIKKD